MDMETYVTLMGYTNHQPTHQATLFDVILMLVVGVVLNTLLVFAFQYCLDEELKKMDEKYK